MIFIRKDDFSIWDDGEHEGEEADLYFEVDECIAPTIRTLNQKGYATTNCCCGHPYPSHGEAWLPLTVEDPFHVIVGTYEAVPEPDDERWFEGGHYHIHFINEPATCSYISFEEGVALPYLPEGWEYGDETNNTVINYYYDDKLEGFKFMRERQTVMEKLYDWAVELPSIAKDELFTDEDLRSAAKAVRSSMLKALEEDAHE